MKQLTTWEKVSRVLRIVEFCIVIFGVVFTVIQIKDIGNDQNNQQTDLMLRYDTMLNSEDNAKLFTTIDRNKPVLLKNGGRFSEDDLDYFLGIINQIGESKDRGILDDEIIYSNFSYIIHKTYNNKEIQEYLKRIRVEDQSYFLGLDELAKNITEEEN